MTTTTSTPTATPSTPPHPPAAQPFHDDPADPHRPSPARQLVLCLDGTSNTLTGRQRDTNVLRLFEHLAVHEDVHQSQQLLYYDPGVGSPDALPVTGPGDWLGRKWERISGLAYGRGIFDNVLQAYAWLMHHWSPGCEVYIFGFSRGAFTARSVAGMVNLFGIVRPEHDALLSTLARVYFSSSEGPVKVGGVPLRQKAAQATLGLELEEGTTRTRGSIAEQIRQSFARGDRAEAGVHFIGVWDTVESVGLPGLALHITSSPSIRGKRMRHVRHALALDEHRKPFEPRLYSENNFGNAADAQSLRQLWFRGVHGDVGGGYALEDSALPQLALVWMADQAWRCGLRCPPLPGVPAKVLAHDPLRTVPWWSWAGMSVRDPGEEGHVTPVEHPSVARFSEPASVWQQHRSRIALLLALLGALLGWWLQSRWIVHGGSSGSAGVDPMWRPLYFALQKLASLWQVPLGTWRTAWHPWAGTAVWPVVWADGLVLASYGYVLACFGSAAFTRLAGWRRGVLRRPGWAWLGLVLPTLLIAHLAENLLVGVGLEPGAAMGWWRGALLGLSGLAAAIKVVAALLMAGLLVMGLFARRR
jgi:uncharacterized protein (DUF2235 family)